MERMDKFMKEYKGPVKYTNLRPMRLVDGKRNKKEKCVPSHTAESKGWTFECNMEYLAEVMIRCWRNGDYQNAYMDIGEYK